MFSNFVGSESGHIKSVKLLQNMGLQHDSTPSPPPHTQERSVEEIMPLIIFWSKFQEKMTNALASSFYYDQMYCDVLKKGLDKYSNYRSKNETHCF